MVGLLGLEDQTPVLLSPGRYEVGRSPSRRLIAGWASALMGGLATPALVSDAASDRRGHGAVANTGRVEMVEFEFEGPVLEWRGPAPFYFVAIPKEESEDIKLAAKGIEYWGQVPVTARIGDTEFSTALFPKDGRYLLPLKAAVRTSARVAADQIVAVELCVGRQERQGRSSAPWSG